MAKFPKPGNVAPTECVFPECASALSEKFELPLCDRHIMAVFRAVASYNDILATERGPDDAAGESTG